MTRNRKHFSILYKYFFSYVMIFFIPLIITGALLYKNAVIDFKSEIKATSLVKLEKVKNILDLQLNQLNEITVKISHNKKLSKFFMESSDYSASEGICELSDYLLNNNLIYEILLYYRGDEVIYSTKGKFTIDVLINRAYRFHKWSYNQFYNDINTINKNTIRGAEKVNINDREEIDVLTFITPISPFLKNPRAVVIYLIQKSSIDNLINNIFNESKVDVYIWNERGEILASLINIRSFNDFNIENIKYDLNRKINEVMIGNIKYYVFNTNSSVTNWKYSIVMPSNELENSIYSNKIMILKVLTAMFLFGILITVLMSIISYKPIKKLSADVGLYNSNNNIAQEYSELEFIKNVIEDTINKNHKLISDMEEQLEFVKEQGIIMLLRGEICKDFEKSNLKKYIKQKLYGPYFSVMVAEIEQYEASYFTDNDSEEGNFINIIKKHELFSEAYATRLIGEKIVVFVFNICGEDKDKIERYRIAKELQCFFTKEINTTVTIGVSRTCNNIFELNILYNEAQTALEYKFLRGLGKIIIFEDILTKKKDYYWYPINEKVQLVNSLKQGDIHNYTKTVSEIFEKIEKRNLSLSILKSLCFDVINALIVTAYDINVVINDTYIEEMINFETISELREKLINVGTIICQYVQYKKESNNEKLRDSLIKYIKENFRDSNLSLENVAAHFNISPIYLSRFFKEQTGYNFIDYIRCLRLEETKRLLLFTRKTIKEIVEEVGYLDVSSFMKLFKAKEGITPGEYRKLYAQNIKSSLLTMNNSVNFDGKAQM